MNLLVLLFGVAAMGRAPSGLTHPAKFSGRRGCLASLIRRASAAIPVAVLCALIPQTPVMAQTRYACGDVSNPNPRNQFRSAPWQGGRAGADLRLTHSDCLLDITISPPEASTWVHTLIVMGDLWVFYLPDVHFQYRYVDVDPNPTYSARSATVTFKLAGTMPYLLSTYNPTVAIGIGQAAMPHCKFDAYLNRVRLFDAPGAATYITVTAIPSDPSIPVTACVWNTKVPDWVTVNSAGTGYGNGSINVTVLETLLSKTAFRRRHLGQGKQPAA